MVFFQLFLMLIVILIAAEVFTNALEHLGEKLGISEGGYRIFICRCGYGLT